MIKRIILSVLVVVALVAAGAVYYQSQNKGQADVKSTKQAIAELFGQKYNRSTDSVNVVVQNDTGTFAKGSVGFVGEPGGGLWFAAKTSKGWELAFDGNGIVTCEAANKYNFPKDMIPQCIDVQNANKLIQR